MEYVGQSVEYCGADVWRRWGVLVGVGEWRVALGRDLVIILVLGVPGDAEDRNSSKIRLQKLFFF